MSIVKAKNPINIPKTSSKNLDKAIHVLGSIKLSSKESSEAIKKIEHVENSGGKE